MSDHDTADRALLERLKMHACVVGQSGIDTGNDAEISVADDMVKAADALARRIAEGARLKEAAEEFLRYHALDCGAHFCRYCSARSPEWEHAEHCSFVLSQAAYTKLRAALVAEEPPR